MTYEDTDVFLLCYDMSSTDTLRNVEFYVEEIIETCEHAYGIVLCGCKYDLWLRSRDENSVDLDEVAQVFGTQDCLVYPA